MENCLFHEFVMVPGVKRLTRTELFLGGRWPTGFALPLALAIAL